MINQHVLTRLEGIRGILMATHKMGQPMSSNSKGREREAFIKEFLAEVFPPIYRFGTGDVTDSFGNRSGQLDVVIEYPLFPTVPCPSKDDPTRLYLAEGVAAVVEVKSNLSSQWREAERTAEKLSTIKRNWGSILSIGRENSITPQNVPLFIVGYTGIEKLQTLKDKVNNSPYISGALVIDSDLFVSKDEFWGVECYGRSISLWAFISVLHHVSRGISATTACPFMYVSQ